MNEIDYAKLSKRDSTHIIKLYATNPDGSTKLFKDSQDKSTSRLVSLYTLCRSEGKARLLGNLEIGESYTEWTGRSFKRIS